MFEQPEGYAGSGNSFGSRKASSSDGTEASSSCSNNLHGLGKTSISEKDEAITSSCPSTSTSRIESFGGICEESSDDEASLNDEESISSDLKGDSVDYTDEENSSSGTDSDPEDQCPICLGEFSDQRLGNPENCRHMFCLQCIEEWAKSVNSCPVDRKKFNLVLVRDSKDGIVLEEIYIPDREAKDEHSEMPPTYCQVCNECDREERLLLCDRCDEGYHLECLTPPLEVVPSDDWYCPNCVQGSLNDALQIIYERNVPFVRQEIGITRRGRPRTAAARRWLSARRAAPRGRRRRACRSTQRSASTDSLAKKKNKGKKKSKGRRISVDALASLRQKSANSLPKDREIPSAVTRRRADERRNSSTELVPPLSLFGDPFALNDFHDADSDDVLSERSKQTASINVLSTCPPTSVRKRDANDVLGDILQGYTTLDPDRVCVRRDGSLVPLSFERVDCARKWSEGNADWQTVMNKSVQVFEASCERLEDRSTVRTSSGCFSAQGLVRENRERRKIRFADEVASKFSSVTVPCSAFDSTPYPMKKNSNVVSDSCSSARKYDFAEDVRAAATWDFSFERASRSAEPGQVARPRSSSHVKLRVAKPETSESLLGQERRQLLPIESLPSVLSLRFKIPKKRKQESASACLSRDSMSSAERCAAESENSSLLNTINVGSKNVDPAIRAIRSPPCELSAAGTSKMKWAAQNSTEVGESRSARPYNLPAQLPCVSSAMDRLQLPADGRRRVQNVRSGVLRQSCANSAHELIAIAETSCLRADSYGGLQTSPANNLISKHENETCNFSCQIAAATRGCLADASVGKEISDDRAHGVLVARPPASGCLSLLSSQLDGGNRLKWQGNRLSELGSKRHASAMSVVHAIPSQSDHMLHSFPMLNPPAWQGKHSVHAPAPAVPTCAENAHKIHVCETSMRRSSNLPCGKSSLAFSPSRNSSAAFQINGSVDELDPNVLKNCNDNIAPETFSSLDPFKSQVAYPVNKEKEKRMKQGIARYTRISLISDKVKLAVKPYFKRKVIDKDGYKQVMRRAVNLLKSKDVEISDYFTHRVVEEIIMQLQIEQVLVTNSQNKETH